MKHVLSAGTFVLAMYLLANTAIAQSTQTFTLTNKAGIVVTSIVVSPAGKNNWSSNLCSREGLLDNGVYAFKYKIDSNNKGIVDIKFRGSSGQDYYLRNVDLKKNTSISLLIPHKELNERAHKSNLKE